jgi:peptide/nickel transport system substrate-binding protein
LDVTIDAKDPTSVYTILRDKRTDWETALTLTRNSYNIFADTPDTTYFYRFHSSRSTGTGWNINGFENATYDQLVESMTQNFNSTDRLQQIFRAQEILASEVPRVSLYHRQILNVYRDDHFSGWTPVVGWGFHNFYNWANLQEVTAVQNTGYELGTVMIVGLVVIVIVVVAVATVYVLKRRSKK